VAAPGSHDVDGISTVVGDCGLWIADCGIRAAGQSAIRDPKSVDPENQLLAHMLLLSNEFQFVD
jgi:hypothetical protein